MGVEIITVTKCTCDICTAECRLDDRLIFIDVKPAERDIGPSQIAGSLLFREPYGTSDGYICKQCKIRYLKQYIKELDS